jgi:hypothetical protein
VSDATPVKKRPARAGRTEHAARDLGIHKRTAEEVHAGAEVKRVEKAALKAAKDTAEAESQQRRKKGAKRLAQLEDARQQQDDADAAEMHDPSAGYKAAQAQANSALRPRDARKATETTAAEDIVADAGMVVDGEKERVSLRQRGERPTSPDVIHEADAKATLTVSASVTSGLDCSSYP